jgi:hypothetical protein
LEFLGETKWPADLDTAFEARLQNCKKQLLASSCLSFFLNNGPSVHPSFCMEQLSSHWTDLVKFDI